jgi:hypothetical protein
VFRSEPLIIHILIICLKEYLDRLEEAGEAPAAEPTPEKKKKPVPAPKKAAPPKKRAQKPTAAEKVRPTKRQKKQATPSDEDDVSASSALSDVPSADSENFEDSDASAAPKPKKKTVLKSKTLVKRGGKKSKPDVSEDSAGDSESDAPPTKKQTPIKKSKAISKPTKSNTKIEKSGSDNESSVLTTQSESEGAPAKTKKASPEPPKPTKMKQPVVKPKFLESDDKSVAKDKETVDDEEKANASDSSEMSVLIDEAPKPKRKKSSKSSEPSKTKTKASKPKAPPKTTTPLSPTEEQIKTLQTQLLKCGIRKIWAFELKQYGDDAKAKIKHLSNMLKDAGMVGRFSESRAREIKELRELQKDLEDVKEGEKSWGMESGRRSRSAVRKVKATALGETMRMRTMSSRRLGRGEYRMISRFWGASRRVTSYVGSVYIAYMRE